MKNKGGIIAALFAGFILAAFSALAAGDYGDDKRRLCTDEDLTGGTWKMMFMMETPARREYMWYNDFPYHYLTFYPGRYYSFAASPTEAMTPDQARKLLAWPQKQHKKLRYTLDNAGVLNLYIDDKRVLYSYRCVALLKDDEEFKKGDLVLTGYTKKYRSQLYKLYRRWF